MKHKYLIYLNGRLLMETFAVSEVKAINNARFRLCQEHHGWFAVPGMSEFEAILA